MKRYFLLRDKAVHWLLNILTVGLAICVAIPAVWMVLCSLQPDMLKIFTSPPHLVPEYFRWQNFLDAIARINMGLLFKNTMILVVSNMCLGIGASILVAYGFARFKSKYSNKLFFLLLSTMMLPWVVTMVPAYVLFDKIGWLGTFLPLIAPSIGGNVFYIFLLRQFFKGIPKDLDEAATIDGCSKFGILVRILLPHCKPVLATLVIFSFSGTWSDYVGPSIYLTKPGMHTLSIGLEYFRSTSSVMPWNLVLAACTLFALPMLIVTFLAQSQFQKGIITTGIK